MQDTNEAVYVWARYYPDHAERMKIIASWCMVHMLTAPNNEFSLTPKV